MGRKRIFRIAAGIMIGLVTLIAFLCFWTSVVAIPRNQIVNAADVPEGYSVAIVLGAKVNVDGEPSDILNDRLLTAYDLYKAKRVQTFLLSGDHGQNAYDEVKAMRDRLLKWGVAPEDIFLDHAGFDTYDSLYRAKEIFGIHTGAVVVTQKFHLPRALMIANGLGMSETLGVPADRQTYVKIEYLTAREFPARLKAFWDLLIHSKPTYLGEPIPITGDGRVTWDDL